MLAGRLDVATAAEGLAPSPPKVLKKAEDAQHEQVSAFRDFEHLGQPDSRGDPFTLGNTSGNSQ